MGRALVTLPPGQRRVDGFPRFGTHLSTPPPPVPADPAITVRGAVTEAFDLPLTALADLPRRELTADFHCVAGWSATDLRWEGVTFATFYRAHVEPALPAGTTITHVTFRGLDGYGAVLRLEDALADDVLIAEHLDGEPLDPDHGAPVRLVSPQQYGYRTPSTSTGSRSTPPSPSRPARCCAAGWCCGCWAATREPGSGRRNATRTCRPGWCDPSTAR